MQDLRTLAIFVKVAERQSFVRASSDLGITQSGVSNAISRLEQQVGTRLLARTTRRVSLTDHGAAYFERCRRALAELEEAELVLKDSQLEPSGNLNRLSGARFKIVRSPRYLAKFAKPRRIEDLTDHNCLAFTFRETHLARAWRFMQEGVEKSLTPKGNMSFSDGAAACDAACAGYGLAQLQDYFADTAIAQGKLVSVLDRFKPKIEPIWLVYPQTRHLTPTVRAFVDFMAAQFRPRQTKS